MRITEYVDALAEHGTALADAAGHVHLDAAVPTCPGWRVGTLLGHVGGVQRWATGYLREGREASAHGKRPGLVEPPDDGLIDWFSRGCVDLVSALRDAPGDLDTWSFLPAPSPLVFWARRQAHETAIHLADVESAREEVPEFDARFATDGIDELASGFLGRRRGTLVADPPRSILIAPDDAEMRWHVTILPDTREISRDGSKLADCTISGSASDLYLSLWNRNPRRPPHVSGDPTVLDLWHRLAHVTWS